MKKIDTAELHERMQAGPVAIFDVRGDVEYEIAHLPGAKTAPAGSLVFRVVPVMNPDSFIVVYSAGNGCTLAADAVTRLENMGMRNVHCYEEGVAGWQDAGHELVPSPYPTLAARGEVVEVRKLRVDTENAYGGAFKSTQMDVGFAGG